MICPLCKIICEYIGTTIGGTRLVACPKCKTVYYEEKK